MVQSGQARRCLVQLRTVPAVDFTNKQESISVLASSPVSPIFSTHARKEGEPGV